ncbi:IS66 family insertion sequence element accessory protein TnpB [Escherichia coli]|nr:IS66 family insertion sequence element accessory protein TnpB [Escherichia coli]
MGDGGDCQCKNMRRGIDTLIQYVQNELNAAWHDGAAFVFTNKARSRIKVRKRKLTAVCSHQTRIGNLDAHLI